MKKLLLLTLLSISIFACSSDDNLENNQTSWELFRITENGNTIDLNAGNAEIQDRITITNDSLFKRVHYSDLKEQQLEGTYSITNYNNNTYLVLKYFSPNAVIGNCSHNQNEVFMFTTNDEMTNTWNECGGPTLEYKKVD